MKANELNSNHGPSIPSVPLSSPRFPRRSAGVLLSAGNQRIRRNTALTSASSKPRLRIAISQRMALASVAASSAGHGNWLSCSPRSSIQCQPVCATSAERMMMPMRSGGRCRNSRSEHRHEQHEHQQLAELDADVERQQRGQQVRSGELQRFAQGERETEAVHQAEREGDDPAPRCRLLPTMFSSAM